MRTSHLPRFRSSVIAAMLATAVIAVSSTVVARQAPASAKRLHADRIMGTHATRGIVQTIDAMTLVIGRPGDRGSMTFTLTPVTRREGTIVVGSAVAVRYREDGRNHIATAISPQRSRN
jgi:hypothetical protein